MDEFGSQLIDYHFDVSPIKRRLALRIIEPHAFRLPLATRRFVRNGKTSLTQRLQVYNLRAQMHHRQLWNVITDGHARDTVIGSAKEIGLIDFIDVNGC